VDHEEQAGGSGEELKSDYPRLYGAPFTAPEQAQALLRDPQLHWKKGRSAYELSHAWVDADGLPKSVSALLAHADEWSDANLAAGFFEHSTALDTMVGPSCTDLLALVRMPVGLGVIAVEGKAGESFGEVIKDWNNTAGKQARLEWACTMFGVDPATALDLRWQLFHRTASAVLEARRFCASHAIMLVHDFSSGVGLGDFKAFAGALSVVGAGENALSEARVIGGVSLRLGWLRDTPTP
jgi:hypothetical protein